MIVGGTVMALFCPHCGTQANDGQVVCLNCGRALPQFHQRSQAPQVQDNGGAGYGILGFFIPLIGLILYLIWKDEKPNSAKAAGTGALIGVIASIVFSILLVILLAASGDYWVYP